MREQRVDEPTETFGHYVLYECLGRGGMATVHRAKKTSIEGFERPVALKRMLPWLSADAEFVKSFVREARLAAQLRHTNIAQTYDLGKADGVYYIAMELVAGRDLREILRHAHNIVGPLPPAVVINLLFQLCDALDYAHTFRDDQGRPLGLVHRDISPANVIVGEDGTAKLVDFGVAKGTTNTLATQSGMLKGKFSYMAPEMLQGQVDARSDLFAVGVVAWELLTAKPLFSGGDDMEILQRIAGWDPPKPSSINPAVPTDLDAWLAMALAKDPRRRFQSAAQMRAGLELVARTPAMRASAPDVAAWIEWAFQQTRPPRRAVGTSPAPAASEPDIQVLVSVLPDDPIADSRSKTLAVDESAIEVEIPRHRTAMGVAMPERHAGRPPGSAPMAAVPVAASRTGSTAIPAPIVLSPTGAVPIPAGSPTVVPQAPTQILMPSSNSSQAYAHPSQAYAQAPSQPYAAPSQPYAASPSQAYAAAPSQAYAQASSQPYAAPPSQAYAQPQAYPVMPMTQAMVLPAQPPGAGAPVPLSSMLPTISPDAGYIVQPIHGVPRHVMSPRAENPALHGDDLRSKPEYIAATAAYQAVIADPPPMARGTPQPHAAADEPRTSRPRSVAQPVARPRKSPVGTVMILVACAAAAVGGFFLVQHFM